MMEQWLHCHNEVYKKLEKIEHKIDILTEKDASKGERLAKLEVKAGIISLIGGGLVVLLEKFFK